MKQRFKVFFSFMLTIWLLSISSFANAHSIPTSYNPAPNSVLEQSPENVTIIFNSKIENNLFSLKVFNAQQQEVTEQDALLDSSQKELSVTLPQLSNGIYTVKFNVVSSDGHPVQDSYSFSVQTPQLDQPSSVIPNKNWNTPAPDIDTLDLNQPSSESAVNNFSLYNLFIYLIRGFYYFGLLWIVGWLFWKFTLTTKGKTIPENYEQWGIIAQMVHLFGLTSMILVQIIDITDSGLMFNPEIPITSIFGLTWIGSFILSLLGFIFLFKSKWIDVIWLLSILMLKGLNGHSSDFEPMSLIIGLNTVHLIGAAIWCSGLIFIMVYWKKQRVHVNEFLPIFSNYAFLSLVIMMISGTVLSIIYLPDIHSLFYTQWGLMLLFKIILVITVAFVGLSIRKRMKVTFNNRLKKFLIIDFILMVLIIGLVSILTYI